jgi:hypothetical protein
MTRAILIAAALVVGIAHELRSEPFTARWMNAETAPVPAEVLQLDLVADGLDPWTVVLEEPCQPGSVCATDFDIPPGDWNATLRVGATGYELSGLSNVRAISVEAAPPPPPPPPNGCEDEPLTVRADLNDDGDVTTLDFFLFLEAFRQ